MLDEKELKKYLGTVDERGAYFRWEYVISQEELTENINHHHSIQAKAIIDLKIRNRGGGGRIILLEVTYIDKMGSIKQIDLKKDFIIRQSMAKSFLYSSAFIVSKEIMQEDYPSGFRFKGAGWGHGVGLCQIGALSMALQGKTAGDIMAHYFPGSELKTIY
jgi:SpoIID/LytB domain protein